MLEVLPYSGHYSQYVDEMVAEGLIKRPRQKLWQSNMGGRLGVDIHYILDWGPSTTEANADHLTHAIFADCIRYMESKKFSDQKLYFYATAKVTFFNKQTRDFTAKTNSDPEVLCFGTGYEEKYKVKQLSVQSMLDFIRSIPRRYHVKKYRLVRIGLHIRSK